MASCAYVAIYLPLTGWLYTCIKRGIIFYYWLVGSREPQNSSRDGSHAFLFVNLQIMIVGFGIVRIYLQLTDKIDVSRELLIQENRVQNLR